MRPLRGIFRTGRASDYWHFVSDPFLHHEWFYPLLWYDWALVIAAVLFLFAFAWPATGLRLLRWVRAADSASPPGGP